MALTFGYGDRRAAFFIDLGDQVVRLGGWSLTSSAELLAPDTSTIALDDVNGDLGHAGDQIYGLKTWVVTEDAAPSGNQLIFWGYIGARDYESADSLNTGESVRITMDVTDLNDEASFYVITGTDGNRPQESVGARISWLIASVYIALADTGLVVYPDTIIDATDYRNQTAADVIEDCAQHMAFNAYLKYDETGGQVGLGFYDPNTSSLDSSTLRLSNIPSEIDSDIFDGDGPTHTWRFDKAKLRRDPSGVAARGVMPYASTTAIRSRTATADTYGRIDKVMADANVKTATAAQRRLAKFLWQSRTERDTITGSVQVPPANVNDVREGQRIQIKTRQLPGYKASYVWCRVLHRSVGQADQTNAFYTIDLTLSPQEAAEPTCADCTPTVTSYPLGGATDYFNPVPDTGDPYGPGVMYMCRSGLTFPILPTPGYIGRWWFKTFGSSGGGPGTVDYAGHNVGNNTLRAVVVGNGTLVVHTVAKDGGAGTFNLNVFRQTTPGVPANQDDYFTLESTVLHTTGDTVTVVVSDADGENCNTIVDLTDLSGVDFGWNQADWTSACE